MKSYDETVNTVFDRIHTFETRKKRRTILIRRIAATCCAVAVLSGGVWYLNHTPSATPVDDNEGTATTKSTNSHNEKLLITVDPEDTVFENQGNGMEDGELIMSNGLVAQPISPALKEKMEQYSNSDVAFAVLVQIIFPYDFIDEFDETSGFFETNEEIIQLSEKLWQVYTAYVDAPPEDPTQKYSTTPDPEKLAAYYAIREEYVKMYTELYGNGDEIENEALRSRVKKDIANLAYLDAMVEWRTFISTTKVITDEERWPHLEKLSNARKTYRAIASEWDHLRTQSLDEYIVAFRQQQLTVLSEFCDAAPVEFDNEIISGYYVELTADAINTLAKRGYYSFRMASPDGSVEADWHRDPDSLDWE